jgi:3'-phosphoadenosine 5'-phosphosulfate sulfotransferase
VTIELEPDAGVILGREAPTAREAVDEDEPITPAVAGSRECAGVQARSAVADLNPDSLARNREVDHDVMLIAGAPVDDRVVDELSHEEPQDVLLIAHEYLTKPLYYGPPRDAPGVEASCKV